MVDTEPLESAMLVKSLTAEVVLCCGEQNSAASDRFAVFTDSGNQTASEMTTLPCFRNCDAEPRDFGILVPDKNVSGDFFYPVIGFSNGNPKDVIGLFAVKPCKGSVFVAVTAVKEGGAFLAHLCKESFHERLIAHLHLSDFKFVDVVCHIKTIAFVYKSFLSERNRGGIYTTGPLLEKNMAARRKILTNY